MSTLFADAARISHLTLHHAIHSVPDIKGLPEAHPWRRPVLPGIGDTVLNPYASPGKEGSLA